MYFSFPDSSVGKESACNARNPSLIPGSGRSAGEGKGYPLQYSWVSLVAQLVKNLPSTRETWVQSLGWQDPLAEGMATHSSILAWRLPMNKRSLAGYSLWGRKQLDTTEVTWHAGTRIKYWRSLCASVGLIRKNIKVRVLLGYKILWFLVFFDQRWRWRMG